VSEGRKGALQGVKTHVAKDLKVRADLHTLTGLTPREVLRRYKGDQAPPGLKYHHVEAWLDGTGKEIPPDHLTFVLELWKSVPEDDFMVPLTEELRELLNSYQAATQIGPYALLSGRRDRPEDVNSSKVQAWMLGLRSHVRRGALQYVLSLWARSPSFVPLGPDLISQIKAERDRTGYSGVRLLRKRSDKPEGLTGEKINSWLSGAAQMARSNHIEYALSVWRSLPDRNIKAHKSPKASKPDTGKR
jgi:hypothetical protein